MRHDPEVTRTARNRSVRGFRDSLVRLLQPGVPASNFQREESMSLRTTAMRCVLAGGALVAAASMAYSQGAAETFSATAAVKTAGNASASVPVTIKVDRKMSEDEAGKLTAAYKSGGAAALRKALVGVPPTGSVQLGAGAATTTRLTVERPTDKGRLLTIVTDTPILFLGAGVPGAKPKEGYDFAIIDIELDAAGNGSGTLAPAAKVTVKDGAFVVEDYASELVRLTGIKKAK